MPARQSKDVGGEYRQLRQDYQTFRCSRLSPEQAAPRRETATRWVAGRVRPTRPRPGSPWRDCTCERWRPDSRVASGVVSRARRPRSALRVPARSLSTPSWTSAPANRAVRPRLTPLTGLGTGRGAALSATRLQPGLPGSTPHTDDEARTVQPPRQVLWQRPLLRIVPGKPGLRDRPPQWLRAPPRRATTMSIWPR